MSESRGPRRLGLSIERVSADLIPETPLARIQAVWAEAAGAQVAAVATPVSYADGRLAIVCSSAVWAQELELLQERLRSSLSDLLDESVPIERFRFRVGSTE